MVLQNKQIDSIFKAKKERRKELASFPIEEKFKILLQLQERAASILKLRGIEKKLWGQSSRLFQVDHSDLNQAETSVAITLKNPENYKFLVENISSLDKGSADLSSKNDFNIITSSNIFDFSKWKAIS